MAISDMNHSCRVIEMHKTLVTRTHEKRFLSETNYCNDDVKIFLLFKNHNFHLKSIYSSTKKFSRVSYCFLQERKDSDIFSLSSIKSSDICID